MNKKCLQRILLTLSAGATLMAGGCGLPSLASLSQAVLIGGVNSVFSQVFGINSITGLNSTSPVSSSLSQNQVTSGSSGVLSSSGMGAMGSSTSILNFSSPSLF